MNLLKKIIHIILAFNLCFIIISNAQVDTNIVDSLNYVENIDSSKLEKDSLSYISKDAIEANIEYDAKEKIDFDYQNGIINLYEQAWVTYTNIKLEAGVISINWDENSVFAKGYYDSSGKYVQTPKFYEGDKEYECDSMKYNFRSRKAKIYNLYTKEGESFIIVEEAKKDENNDISSVKVKYTTCDQREPHFYISAKKVKILENKVITGPANLVIEGIPLPLGIPFGFFPKQDKQSSGIIIPAYGESTDRGFFLRGGGYYFGFSDYFDLKLVGDIYSRGSWLVNAQSNYRVRYKYNGNLDVKYAYNKFGDPETPDFRLSKDFNIRWTHNQDPKARPNSNFRASVNAGSQNSFRNNSNNTNDILQNTLRSSISYKTFAGTPFSMTASLSHDQNLANHILNLTAPEMGVNMSRIYPFRSKKGFSKKKWYHDIGMRYSMNFRNSLATSDTAFLDPDIEKQWRNGIRHTIPINTSFKMFKYINVSPNLNYTGRTYFERKLKTYYLSYPGAENDTMIETIENGVFHAHDFNASLNMNTRIYGMFKINKFNLIAIRHLITPTIGFSYTPDMSDQKFGYYKSVQTDSVGNTQTYSVFEGSIIGSPGRSERGNITFGFQNNIEAKLKPKVDTTDAETRKVTIIESFNINGSYNIFADSMNLSNISFSARSTVFKSRLNIQLNGTLNPYYINPKDSLMYKDLEIVKGNKLGRITNGYLSMAASLRPIEKGKEGTLYPAIYSYFLPYSNYYVDFDVPWNVSINYNLNYTNFSSIGQGRRIDSPIVTQTLAFNGNVSLTKNWKINFSSGYDLKNKEFTFTSFDLHRDLHCWEMSFSWIPFGFRQQYVFKINVKSSLLQDLKFDRKKYFFDY